MLWVVDPKLRTSMNEEPFCNLKDNHEASSWMMPGQKSTRAKVLASYLFEHQIFGIEIRNFQIIALEKRGCNIKIRPHSEALRFFNGFIAQF